MQTDQVTKISAKPKVAGLKKTAAPAPKTVEGNSPTDKLTLSVDAKKAIELNRFVEMLRKMPDVRNVALEKDFDFSSSTILREVAHKIAEDI